MHFIVKKTLTLIANTGNHFVAKVKANQPRLLRAIEAHVSRREPIEHFRTDERSRGRKERRTVEVYSVPERLDRGWPPLSAVLFVTRSGERDGRPYQRSGYYITSLHTTAGSFAEGLRGHWLIENRLHYVKDVIANEDGSGIKSAQAAANLSLLKNLTLNVYRHQGYQSFKYATEQFANKVKELLFILRT